VNNVLKKEILKICKEPIKYADIKQIVVDKGLDTKKNSVRYMLRKLTTENKIIKIEYSNLYNLKICYYLNSRNRDLYFGKEWK